MTTLTLEQALRLAAEHHRAGRLGEAESLYRQVLAHRPDHPETMHLLGFLCHQSGRSAEAEDWVRRAIVCNPNESRYHRSLGVALAGLGRLDEAMAAYQAALALRAGCVETLSYLGAALREAGRLEEAASALRRALELRPDFAEAHNDLGNVHKDLREWERALASYRRALELKPDFAEAHSNAGAALQELADFAGATLAYSAAVRLHPMLPQARFGLGSMLLLQGDFGRGWPLYEARWEMKRHPRRRTFAEPMWDGSPLDGRRILLHAEQGLGDTIQFVRYARVLADRGAEVIVLCQPGLRRLLEGQCGIGRAMCDAEPLPEFDVHCPLASVARILGTTLDSIPNHASYLYADAAQAAAWGERLASRPAERRVGLAWAGSARHPNDYNRSMSLADFAPLAGGERTRFYSLQMGAAGAQARASPAGLTLVDWTAELRDMADTAALVSNLDLVITVDTAIAHLAGAMGKRVWVLIPFSPDWRWLLNRSDSPWYPTMRLFRQSRRGDWSSPVGQLARELSAG